LEGDRRAELLVDEHAGHRRVGSGPHGLKQALEDEVLRVGDDRRLLGVGLTLDAEELLLEGAAVVEREDVELLLVARSHAREYFRAMRAGVGRSLEWIVMSSGADLFVVCKQCGSEVSPYITECPYCGHRLRRRAPKLPREHALGRSPRGLMRRVRWRPRRARSLAATRRRLPRWGGESGAISPPFV